MRSILYVQYTDPAAYPPLIRSALLLAEKGWQVRLIGVEAQGAARDLKFPVHPSISINLMPQPAGGWRKIVGYSKFLALCRGEVKRTSAGVVYCSDIRSYPVGLWATVGAKCLTVLHEHDPPSTDGGALLKTLRKIRRTLARRATIVVVPQDERARRFIAETDCSPDRMHVVYNCPLRREAEALDCAQTDNKSAFTLWYHGALGAGQLPMTVIDALAELPDDVRLEVAGYETVSAIGYVARMQARARELGLSGRVHFHGAVPERADLLRIASRADLGLSLFATRFRDPMVGASNKPFDYLACGLPLLVPSTEEWRDFFGTENVAVDCSPEDPHEIAKAVLALRNDPVRRRAMAERGRHLVETKWNYESQFQKVEDLLEANI